MKIAISGSTGLIGSTLAAALKSDGHEVLRIVRGVQTANQNQIRWDPSAGTIDEQALERVDAVVHLAGENIARRWNAKRKAEIRDSRVNGTRLLCEALARRTQRPRALLSASAIGYFGDRGDEVLDETSPRGAGFLAEVCSEWEAATASAANAGIRVVNLRFGVVLGRAGGALAKMLTPFRLGLGGRLGSGRQYMSWVALDDAVGAAQHALATESLYGPVNVVAPQVVTNQEFTKTLGRVLCRPTIFPMPALAARLAFGEMADELLLASTRVVSRRLAETRYPFRFPQLEPALRHVLGYA